MWCPEGLGRGGKGEGGELNLDPRGSGQRGPRDWAGASGLWLRARLGEEAQNRSGAAGKGPKDLVCVLLSKAFLGEKGLREQLPERRGGAGLEPAGGGTFLGTPHSTSWPLLNLEFLHFTAADRERTMLSSISFSIGFSLS